MQRGGAPAASRNLLWSWGWGPDGQLGFNDTSELEEPAALLLQGNVSHISCGPSHSLAVVDGVCYSWGRGTDGQLGTGATCNVDEPTAIVMGASGDRVTSLAASSAHSAATTHNGELYAWGMQLGGAPERSLVPTLMVSLREHHIVQVACGEHHSCCVTREGKIFSWGKSDHGQLGHGDFNPRDSPTLLKGLQRRRAARVGCAAYSSGSVLADGSVWTWGQQHDGQLGHGTSDPCAQGCPEPRCVEALRGKDPIIQLSCGKSQ